MRRFARWSAIGASVVATIVLTATGVVTWTVRRSLPDYDATTTLPGLTAPVTVYRDGYGIPQIYADTAQDLFRAQGWVSAQDRFWEMDFRRHVTAGRLSELFGASQVEADAFVRTLGWRRVASQELALLQPATRRYLRAYADGVNAWLHERSGADLSLQHGILAVTNRGYVPERWSPVDSLAWLKALAWDLRSNINNEISRVLATEKLPPERVEQLYPPYPYARHATIVGTAGPRAPQRPPPTTGATAAIEPYRHVARAVAATDAVLGPASEALGSNALAVSGALTSTGRPLLANDPHLAPAMPSTWTQVGLHCRVISRSCPFDVAGFTFSGLPGVVIGHNDRVAWGFTNLAPDVSDLYLERVRGSRYLTEHGEVPLAQRRETIRVAGGDDVPIVVRATRHGPLVSDVSLEQRRVGQLAPVLPSEARPAPRGSGYAVALRWTALDPGRTGDALFALARASDWPSFRRAAATFEVPAQNLVYADVDGHIGYQAPGRIPIRSAGDGRWPAVGWTGRDDWTGFVPFAALPSELDPPDGMVVTANQAVAPRSYPYLLTTDWAYGYRSQRIRDLLEQARHAGRKVAVADLAALQMDSAHPAAGVLLPRLLQVPGLTGYDADGQEVLRHWDGSQSVDSAGAAYFNAVWRRLLQLTFDDELPEQGARPDGGERWVEVVRSLLSHPEDPYWDDVTTPNRETRDTILRAAMVLARDDVTRLSAKAPADWEWGRMHTIELRDASFGRSGIGPIEAMVNRGPYPVGGGSGAVQATSWDARQAFDVTALPSMRMVVDLGRLGGSGWVNLTGQSGHPYDPHYVDQVELWRTGQLTAMRWGEAADRGAAEHTTTLTPRA